MLERNRAQVGDTTKLPRKEEKDQKIKTNQKKEEKEKSLFDPGRHFPVPY